VIADPWFYAAAVPAILLIGIAKGGFGSGAGIFATPLMALTVPIPQAAAILLPILCVMDAVGLWAYRGRFTRVNLRMLLAGGVIGVALGTLTFRYFDESRGLPRRRASSGPPSPALPARSPTPAGRRSRSTCCRSGSTRRSWWGPRWCSSPSSTR
jgi:hypothetical protein